jgi:hypothetical protein
MKLHHRNPIFMFWLVTVIALPAFDFSASAADSSLVYSSFGPGNTYDTGQDWVVSCSATATELQAHAEYFVPAFSGYLSQIQVATKLLGGDALTDFFHRTGQWHRDSRNGSGEFFERDEPQWPADAQLGHRAAVAGGTEILAVR